MLRKISSNISKTIFNPVFFFSKAGVKKTHDFLVEIDPIYPDMQQAHKSAHRAPHRAPPQASIKKIEKAQIGMADYLLRKSQAKILNISSFKSKGKIQEKEINKLKFIEDIAKDFKIDPILQLPYGFQFDNYITKQRNESMQRESSKLEELISSIFKKLKLRNEFELAILRKHAFSTNDKENFKEKARKTILQRFLKEIAKIRKEDGKKILETADRYFENFAANKEFYLASLKDIEIANEDEIFEKLSDKVKTEKIDEVSQALSLENLENKVQTNKAQELNAYKPGYRDIISFDKFFFAQPLTESSGEEVMEVSGSDHPALKSHNYSYQVSMMDEEEFEKYQLWRDVKKNYFKNKIGHYTELLDKKEKSVKFIEEEIENNKKVYEDTITENLETYAKTFNIEEFYKKPNFEEIYDSIDNLLINMPISKINDAQIDKNPKKTEVNDVPLDYLWKNITSKFEKVIPQKYYKFDSSVESLADRAEQIDRNIREFENQNQMKYFHLQPTVTDGIINNETVSNFKFENDVFDETILNSDERVELEIFRQVRKDPFFHHHLSNNLKYFSERMLETNLALKNSTTSGQPNQDYLNYISPVDEIKDRQIMEQLLEQKNAAKKKIKTNTLDKFFCGGRRKTAHAMAIVSPGRGEVKVNHVSFSEYFFEQFHRSTILYPIKLANLACLVNVDLFVRGGGISAQVHSCQMALARCLIKKNPLLKTLFKKLLLIRADRRQVERKHVGHYKARKKFPYKRR